MSFHAHPPPPYLPCSQMQARGGFFWSLISCPPMPTPLTRKREPGVGLFVIPCPPTATPPPSLANASQGWVFFVVDQLPTNAHPSHSQTRARVGFVCRWDSFYVHPPPHLPCSKCELEVVFFGHCSAHKHLTGLETQMCLEPWICFILLIIYIYYNSSSSVNLYFK